MMFEEVIKSIKLEDEIVNYLSSGAGDFAEIYDQIKTEISNFEYATDEYYSNLPLYHEINKFKRGKLLKSVDNENLKRNTYLFGFSDKHKLLLTEKVNDDNPKFGVNSSIYLHQSDSIIKFFTFINSSNQQQNKLISRGILIWVGNDLQVELSVSSNLQNWSLTSYFYENDKISKIRRNASGWNGETEYHCIYDKDTLTKIKIGEIIWWKSKNK